MRNVIFILLTSAIILSLTATIPEKRQTNNNLDESVKENVNKIFSTKTDGPYFNDLLDSFGGPNPEKYEYYSKLEKEKQKESDNKDVHRPKDETNFETANPGIENEQQEAPQTSEEKEEDNPKTGFYFLIDWNTFLEVDDQLGRRVNLRIQPKVGDPKRFFSVTVP